MIDGKRMKRRREELGMSLAALSKESGVSTAYLSELENKEGKSPSHSVVVEIAEALEVSIFYLTGATDEAASEICGNCHFFDVDGTMYGSVNNANHDGVCRRYPPQKMMAKDYYRNDWMYWVRPQVNKGDTCGEFQPIRSKDNGRS